MSYLALCYSRHIGDRIIIWLQTKKWHGTVLDSTVSNVYCRFLPIIVIAWLHKWNRFSVWSKLISCFPWKQSVLEISTFQNSLNQEVAVIHDWCVENKLTTFPTKCNALVICPQVNKPVTNLCPSPGSVVDAVPRTKYLCITKDLKSNFQNHIHSIEQKLSKTIGIMCKVKTVLP